MKIGFIGLGAMGRPMAERLIGARYELVVFDVVTAGVDALVAAGAERGLSPRHVAEQTQVTLTSLPNAAIVASVMTGSDGVFAGTREGHTVVDLSSVGPESTKKLAGQAALKGIDYLDAPVSGGVKGALSGSLTIMVGAPDEAAFLRVKPILDVLGSKVYFVGDIGNGNSVKIINNMLLGANMASLAEALVLGMKIGLDPHVMYEILSQSSGRSYALDAKMPNFIMKGDFAPGFMVELQHKDLTMAVEAARDVSMPLPMTATALQVFEMARAKGFGKEDISSVVKVWEELMATRVRG
jgi:3-hydroxyisobutyrate dehydrogenase